MTAVLTTSDLCHMRTRRAVPVVMVPQSLPLQGTSFDVTPSITQSV